MTVSKVVANLSVISPIWNLPEQRVVLKADDMGSLRRTGQDQSKTIDSRINL
jgi:hypothetical protein